MVSLIRFSFSEDTTKALASKIRHFYDLYYLMNDSECLDYIQSPVFKADLSELFTHDQHEFDEPKGWQTKIFAESPLVTNFLKIWDNMKATYQNEVTHLAFVAIPNERLVKESFERLIRLMQ